MTTAQINALATTLQRFECAAWRGQQINGHPFHAGSRKAYAHALALLVQQFPHALDAAVACLDKDVDAQARADYRQALQAVLIDPADQATFANVGLPAVDDFCNGDVAIVAADGDAPAAPVPPHHKA